MQKPFCFSKLRRRIFKIKNNFALKISQVTKCSDLCVMHDSFVMCLQTKTCAVFIAQHTKTLHHFLKTYTLIFKVKAIT